MAEKDIMIKCERCGKEEKKYWIEKYGVCFWCNQKEEDKRWKEKTSKETIKSGSSDNEDSIFCPWCGHECSDEELYESTDTYCDKCDKEFHLEIEHTPSYSTSKLDSSLK